MTFISRWLCCALGVGACLTVGAQPYLIGSREHCVTLPNHAAIQECQAQQKAEYKDWQKQMNDRYAPQPPRLNGVVAKPQMNCFKREATGEQLCAN